MSIVSWRFLALQKKLRNPLPRVIYSSAKSLPFYLHEAPKKNLFFKWILFWGNILSEGMLRQLRGKMIIKWCVNLWFILVRPDWVAIEAIVSWYHVTVIKWIANKIYNTTPGLISTYNIMNWSAICSSMLLLLC